MIVFYINLQILIILWWVGAIVAGLSLLIPQYTYFLIGGSLGWITVVIASGLIIYALNHDNNFEGLYDSRDFRDKEFEQVNKIRHRLDKGEQVQFITRTIKAQTGWLIYNPRYNICYQ